MNKALSLCIALAMASCPAVAGACRQPIPSAKAKLSDLVVEGEAFCLETPGICRLSVTKVLKGDAKRSGTVMTIVVDDAPPIDEIDGRIVVGRCPHTFEPWKAQIAGKFYLTIMDDGSFFAAYPPDATEEEFSDENKGDEI